MAKLNKLLPIIWRSSSNPSWCHYLSLKNEFEFGCKVQIWKPCHGYDKNPEAVETQKDNNCDGNIIKIKSEKKSWLKKTVAIRKLFSRRKWHFGSSGSRECSRHEGFPVYCSWQTWNCTFFFNSNLKKCSALRLMTLWVIVFIVIIFIFIIISSRSFFVRNPKIYFCQKNIYFSLKILLIVLKKKCILKL